MDGTTRFERRIERLQREILWMEQQVGLVLTNIAQITPNTVKKDYLQISRIKHIEFQIFYADLPSKGCSCKEIGCFGMDY